MSTELALVLGVVAFYLYDSALLLNGDEAVIVNVRRGRWRAMFGAQQWRLARREPLLPNPLTPHRRMMRVRWSVRRPIAADPAVVQRLREADVLDDLWPLIAGMALALFAYLPLGLFTAAGINGIGAAIGVYYLSAALAMGVVWSRRNSVGVKGQELIGIFAQCLFCPPVGLNLVRKVSLAASTGMNFDLNAVASSVMREEELNVIRHECLRRVDEQIDLADEDSLSMQTLLEGKGWLTGKEQQE